MKNWRSDLPIDIACDAPWELAAYSCPLVNPPAQRHMFENKIHNIQLAISRIQPPLLAPGQEFSFWHYALAPTAENGYREGAMFINHQVKASLGGGLCQLSGLIYNLALLSGCKIMERYNHSIDAYGEDRYIPLGRDATVAYGKKDLRFSNPHAFPIKFELHVDAQHAWGKVCGAHPLEARISIETALIKTLPSPMRRVLDKTLAPGQETSEPGLTGKVVMAWRIIEKSGQLPYKESLSHDHYRATPTRLRWNLGPDAPWMKKILAHLGMHG